MRFPLGGENDQKLHDDKIKSESVLWLCPQPGGSIATSSRAIDIRSTTMLLINKLFHLRSSGKKEDGENLQYARNEEQLFVLF